MSKISECNQKVLSKGKHVATIFSDIEPGEIEKIVKTAAMDSGEMIDWTYVGGVACIKAIGDIKNAKVYLKIEFSKHHDLSYRFTTDYDSIIPISYIK